MSAVVARWNALERDISPTGTLARFASRVRAIAVVTRYPDLRIGAEFRARLARVAIVLAEMDAVRTDALGERDAVVDDERDLAIRAHTLERIGERRGLVLVDALDAKLERRDRRGIERPRQPLGEPAADVERRDEIELAGRTPHVAAKPRGEIGVERA